MNTVNIARSVGLTVVALIALAAFLAAVLALKLAEGVFVAFDIGANVLRECWKPGARL